MSKKNFTISTVATAPSPTTSGTSLVVATGHGTRFATGEPAVICPVNTSPDSSNAEIVTISNVVGDTLTIVREQESTTARDIQVGDVIFQQISAKDYNDLLTLATHTNRSDLDNVSGTNTGDDASIPIGYLDTDGTLAGDSDVKVPTQKAVKAYADGKIAKATNVTALNDTGIADGEVAVFNLTNKDIRTSNVLISTDGTLAGNADTNLPTEKAVKTYIDGTKFVWKGAWVTDTAFVLNDVVEHEGSAYICVTGHTSGTFATDLGAGKWELFVEGVGGNSIQVDSSGGTSDTYGTLSGLVNSSNTVYTVSLGSYISGSLRVYLNGQLQTQGSGEDWTETTPASGTFTFNTAPSTGDIIIVMYQFSSGSTGNADTVDNLHASSFAPESEWENGWISAGETWTYASADDPTYTFTIASDVTGKYSVGMKIKLTQTTVKYFIITAVSTYSGGNTTITVYGGTDYDLANATISANYYSMVRCPFGFPMSPAKWTVTTSDTSQVEQTSPTDNTWYNLGGNISIPIGVWDVRYQASIRCQIASGGSNVYSTLSTANNSESDATWTTYNISASSTIATTINRRNILTLTTKTSYYLNLKNVIGGTSTHLRVAGNLSPTLITAICLYL